MAVGSLDVSCAACGARLVIATTHRTARCPYCDSPSVVDRPATEDRPDPIFAIGFAVDRGRAGAALRAYLQRRRWAPGALRRATADKVEGVYLPGYLYSAVASSEFSAQIGETYTELQFDPKKKRMRRVTKIEFLPLSGHHRCYVGDRFVTASESVANTELQAIEPFDLGGLRRYGPALVSGWIAEEPSLGREACLELARAEARAEVHDRLVAFMPGDSHHSLHSAVDLTDEALDLVLLPVWVCSVRWRSDRPPVRLLVNGQTGAIGGEVPVSWAKIAAAVGAGLALVGLGTLVGALLGWFG
ncbi:MAG: hypothetical protein PVG53_12130 [Holophagae bacterium]|jgi:hypothetical protein